MNSFFLASIPAFSWAVAAIFDKILVSKYVKDGLTAGIFTNLFSGVAALFLILFFPINSLPNFSIFSLLFIGMLWGWNRLTWVKAMSLEEASRIVAIAQITPVLVLFGSVLFFNEVLAINDFFAFALILGGVYWMSVKKAKGAFHFTPAIGWMILNAILFAATTLLLKMVAIDDWFTALFWLNLGFAIGSIPFLFFKMNSARRSIIQNPFQILMILLAINIGTITGRAAYFVALKLIPAAIASVLAATQSVIVFVIALFLTFYFPSILKEDYHLSAILGKLGALFLIILGICLLYLG